MQLSKFEQKTAGSWNQAEIFKGYYEGDDAISVRSDLSESFQVLVEL
jgi:hypothetical protein